MTCLRFNFMAWCNKNDLNQYPKVYSRAININNSERYIFQINKFFEPLKKLRHASVAVSAYIDKSTYETKPTAYQRDEQIIMRSIKPKAREEDHDVVFVWDIGDITMLPINYILELSMLRPDISATSLYLLQKRILDSVMNLEDSKSITRKVDNIEDAFLDDTEEMKKVAPMYNALRKLYNSVKTNADKEKESIIPHELFEKLGILEHKEELCQVAEKHQEVYHQRWKAAKRCLELVNTRSAESKNKKFANVVLSSQGVASGIAQLLVSSLSSEVNIDKIYSTFRLRREPNLWRRMKALVERLQQRFGENCLFVHVTSGGGYGEIPLRLWSIESTATFDYIYNFQRDTLLQ